MLRRLCRLIVPLLTLLSLVGPGARVSAVDAGIMEPHPMWGGTLLMPHGFSIDVYASGFGNARLLAFRPSDGLLFVTDSGGKLFTVAKGGQPQVFASGLSLPSSVTFKGDYVYVGETSQISRFYAPNNATFPLGPAEVVVPNLPFAGYHWTRTVAFGPDGKLYVGIGSDCEACEEADTRRGSIMVYDADGTNGRPYATGLRNAVGFVWQPGTNQMWATNNENDETGDDFLSPINDGVFYGWPYCYGPVVNAHYSDPARCTNVPSYAAVLGAHSTPLGLTFGAGFKAPPEYQQSIFIAEHGGYDGGTGYRIARVPVVNGKAGDPQDFAIGWRASDQDVWGRPTGIAIGPDGAMYISEDMRGIIYRVTATP